MIFSLPITLVGEKKRREGRKEKGVFGKEKELPVPPRFPYAERQSSIGRFRPEDRRTARWELKKREGEGKRGEKRFGSRSVQIGRRAAASRTHPCSHDKPS